MGKTFWTREQEETPKIAFDWSSLATDRIMTSFLANDGHVPYFVGLQLESVVFLLLPFIFRFHLPCFT